MPRTVFQVTLLSSALKPKLNWLIVSNCIMDSRRLCIACTLIDVFCFSQTKLYIYVLHLIFVVMSYRRFLQSKGFLDISLCLYKDSDETIYLPLLKASLSEVDLQSLRTSAASDSVCEIVLSQVGMTWFSHNAVLCITLNSFIFQLTMSN